MLRRAGRGWSLGGWLALWPLVLGCVQRMADQPRLESQEWHAGLAALQLRRAPPPHTIPAAQSQDHSSAASQLDAMSPAELQSLIRRGRERFEIYCAPCHDSLGSGNGMAARRGMTHPPSYHTDRLRAKPIDYFFAVATNGHGIMPPYGEMISDADRWAIAAFVRTLQFSQFAPQDQLSQPDRAALGQSAPPAEPDASSAQQRPAP